MGSEFGHHPEETKTRDWLWPWWPLVPIYPYSRRRTLRREVVPDQVWTFDQVQGIFYVVVPVRMTVVKVTGGLLVYAPVAPTRECVALMRELEAKYGQVKYIILPTASGLEHKVFVGPFARRFPQAQVFVALNQWSFPVSLPLSWLGMPGKRTQILPANCQDAPFYPELEYQLLGPIQFKPGAFAEVAFFHKASQSLLVTDTLVSVPEFPPDVVELDPYPLLFHAKADPFDLVEDTPDNRCRGWQRICLFALYFRPSVLNVIDLKEAFRDSFKAPVRSKETYFGIFPFRWQDNWQASFEELRSEGKMFVAPILQTLILNRAPGATLEWVNQVSAWSFSQIIPCHFDSPIVATGKDLREAFSFLKSESTATDSLKAKDLTVMQEIDEKLRKRGILPPAKQLH